MERSCDSSPQSLTTTQEQLTTLRALPSRSRTPVSGVLANHARLGQPRRLPGITRTETGPLAELLAVLNLDQGDLVLVAKSDDQLLVGLLLAVLVQDTHVCLTAVEGLGSLTETAGKTVVHQSQLQDTLEGIENGHLALGGVGGNLDLIGDLGGVVLFYVRLLGGTLTSVIGVVPGGSLRRRMRPSSPQRASRGGHASVSEAYHLECLSCRAILEDCNVWSVRGGEKRGDKFDVFSRVVVWI